MDKDAGIPTHRKQAVTVIKRGGEHLLSLIEGTQNIARVEADKLTLDIRPMAFAECMQEVASLFELQAGGKGLALVFEASAGCPSACGLMKNACGKFL